jgi:hypothetical protein
MYSANYIVGFANAEDTMQALGFGFLFTLIFFIVNVVSILHRQSAEARNGQMFLAFGTALYLVGWIMQAIPEQWQSLVLVSWALAFTGGAVIVYLYTTARAPFFVYAATSVSLLGVATALELSGPALTIAFVAEITLLIAVARHLFQKVEITNYLSLLFVAPIVLSFEDLTASVWQSSVLHSEFFATLTLMAGLVYAAAVMRMQESRTENPDRTFEILVLSVVGVYAVVLVWLVSHALLIDTLAVAFALFVYAVSGVVGYLAGVARDNVALKTAGGILIGLVVGRLLLIEVWQMETALRIVTFFVIGVLFMSTAFLRRAHHQ